MTYYKCPVLINYDVTIVGYNAAATYVLGTFSGSNARASLKTEQFFILQIQIKTESVGQILRMIKQQTKRSTALAGMF